MAKSGRGKRGVSGGLEEKEGKYFPRMQEMGKFFVLGRELEGFGTGPDRGEVRGAGEGRG
jgi:hypothetical protein